MKKALIELDLTYHTVDDLAKALNFVKVQFGGLPLDDNCRLFCKAVFADAIDLLTFYSDIVSESSDDI